VILVDSSFVSKQKTIHKEYFTLEELSLIFDMAVDKPLPDIPEQEVTSSLIPLSRNFI